MAAGRWGCALRRMGAVVTSSMVLVVATAGAVQASDDLASEGGMGALAAVATLPYGPAKILYATGGVLFGGLAWAFSGGDKQVLEAVVTPAVRGDYVVTPSVLRGNENLRFFGQDPAYRDDVFAGANLVEDPVD